MVVTDRQRLDLHEAIYSYLISRPGDGFVRAAAAFFDADPDACNNVKKSESSNRTVSIPLLEKKWTAVIRLQKRVLELERSVAQSIKVHPHVGEGNNGVRRRMIPRQPCKLTLEGHCNNVTCLALHPTYTVLVSGSDDATVKIWDSESGDFVRTLKGHTGSVNAVAFSPTGSHIASASSDLSIKLWELKTYKCIRTLRGHDHSISCVIFLPFPDIESSSSSGNDTIAAGSTQLVSASRDRTVKIWELESGFCIHTFSDHSDWVRCLAITSNGEIMASSGSDSVIILYKMQRGRKKYAELRGHEHVVESVSFVLQRRKPQKESIAQTSEAKRLEQIGKYLASGGRDKTVRLWDISSSSCLSIFSFHENWVRCVLLHPSGSYIISCGDDRSIRVFDIKSNRCLRTIDDAHRHFVTSIAMHPTLPCFVSGSVDHTIKSWSFD